MQWWKHQFYVLSTFFSLGVPLSWFKCHSLHHTLFHLMDLLMLILSHLVRGQKSLDSWWVLKHLQQALKLGDDHGGLHPEAKVPQERTWFPHQARKSSGRWGLTLWTIELLVSKTSFWDFKWLISWSLIIIIILTQLQAKITSMLLSKAMTSFESMSIPFLLWGFDGQTSYEPKTVCANLMDLNRYWYCF